jgi:hypothetical protein
MPPLPHRDGPYFPYACAEGDGRGPERPTFRPSLPVANERPNFGRVSSDERRSSEPPTAFNSADPPRNFALPIEERVRALTIGAPAYALRKRRIEDTEEKLTAALVALHDALVAKGQSEEHVTAAMLTKAESFDLTKLNVLITNHNRWYPIEANLAFSKDGYLVFGRPWKPEEPCTAERLVAHAKEQIARKL